MELSLKQDRLSGYRTVLDTALLHEETMEAIVPDACPDILEITDTWGQILMESKEAQEGRCQLTGTAVCTVLYLPEGAGGTGRMEVEVPFSCTVPGERIAPGCRVTAVPRVSAAEARLLNPRKVLLRLEVHLEVGVYGAVEETFCTCVEEEGVEQLVESCSAYLTAAVQEKPFSFEDELDIPGGRPEARELLRNMVSVQCGEARIIGNKLIFKGEAALKILYATEGGETASAEFTLPFSQIMEVSGVGEEAHCAVEVGLTQLSCTLLGDGRAVAVSMELLAQAVVWDGRTMELLSDLYCTDRAVRPEMQAYSLTQLAGRGSRRQSLRDLLETNEPVKAVCDAYLCLGRVEQSREGEHLTMNVGATVHVLYTGEDGRMRAAEKRISVPCTVEGPEYSVCRCICRDAGQVFASPAAGGIEVRFEVDFSYTALSTLRTTGVTGAQVSEEEGPCQGERPSIILRTVGSERLWDIAKSYRTTRADILRANELESGEELAGKLLLIPRKR